tara:strand:- start:38 stop:628 length:591 start_codon:yes stop_codon:yes gene_type:complete
MKSKNWLNRQDKDIYVKKAKNDGFVSRSAYKLLEIESKHSLIVKSFNILELGSAPGSWSQVISKINKNAKIDAFDLLDMKYKNDKINFIKKNFLHYNFNLSNKKYDLILSDIAPNSIGHKSTDHLRIANIILDLISLCPKISLPESNFICKIWKGKEENNIIQNLKKLYDKVTYFKPRSSRNESSEIYLIAQKFKY